MWQVATKLVICHSLINKCVKGFWQQLKIEGVRGIFSHLIFRHWEGKNCKTHYIGAKWSKFLHVGGIWAYFPTWIYPCTFLNFTYLDIQILAYLHTCVLQDLHIFSLACFYIDCCNFVKCFNWIPINLYASCVKIHTAVSLLGPPEQTSPTQMLLG